MNKINSVRDFSKSRFTVCFLIAMLGLWGLVSNIYAIDIWKFVGSSDFEGIAKATQMLFNFQALFGEGFMTDIFKFIAFMWLLIFLVPVFSGNKMVSVIVGALTVIFAFILLGKMEESFYTIGNKFVPLMLLYYGWYIAATANSVGKDFKPSTKEFTSVSKTFGFLLSRMFFGYCLLIAGVIILKPCFASVWAFVTFTQNENLNNFLIGNGCLILGMIFMFASRNISGFVIGGLSFLFCCLVVLQLPTLILLFKNKSLIGIYYSNIAFHWSMIVVMIVYFLISLWLFFSSNLYKYS